jgi:hypothetical protein
MARQQALPASLAPRLISWEAAAAYVGVSPTTFDHLVKDGMMPRPRRPSVAPKPSRQDDSCAKVGEGYPPRWVLIAK